MSTESTEKPPLGDEQTNVRNLVRVVSGFIAFPSLTIATAMMLDFDEHALHILGLFPVGVAAVVLFTQAERIARKFVPDGV